MQVSKETFDSSIAKEKEIINILLLREPENFTVNNNIDTKPHRELSKTNRGAKKFSRKKKQQTSKKV